MDCEALAILGGGLTGLAVVRNAHALGLEPILVLHGVAEDVAAASRYARVTRPAALTPAAVLAGIESHARGRRTALVATSDAWLRFVLEHRPALAAKLAPVLHAGEQSLRTCLDKAAFAAWAAAHGVPAPRRFSGDALSDASALPFPLFLRPAETRHGDERAAVPKAQEVAAPAELRRALDDFERAGVTPLVTESLLGRHIVQYAVGAARCGERIRSFVARKLRPHPRQCAVGTFVELCPHPGVEAVARDALAKLDYQGMAEVEVLHDPATAESWIIEINARPWIQYALAWRSGHDFLRFLLDPSTRDPAGEVGQGMAWIDFNGDLFNCFSRSVGLVRRGEVPLRAYLASLARVRVPARFDLRDPRPFCYDAARLASMIFGGRGGG